MKLLRVFGHVWCSPVTIVGFIVLHVFVLLRYVKKTGWHGSTHLSKFTKKCPQKLVKRYFSHPFVIGHVAIINIRHNDDVYNVTMINHAVAHSRQWMTFGVFMPFVKVAVWLLLRALVDVDNKFDDPLEIDARRAARQTVDIPRLRHTMLHVIRESKPK